MTPSRKRKKSAAIRLLSEERKVHTGIAASIYNQMSRESQRRVEERAMRHGYTY